MFPIKKSLLLLAIIPFFMQTALAENNLLQIGKVKDLKGIVMQENLNSRQIALVKIAAFTANGDLDKLAVAINDGFDAQISIAEMKDLMTQLYAYCGFPKSLNALGVLDKEIKKRREKGLKIIVGTENKIISQKIDSLKIGTETQTQLTGNKVDLSHLSADVDYYLKAHLFGDIFASNQFSWAEREIITVAALSAMSGVEPQKNAHINVAKKNGVSDNQIKEIEQIIQQQAMMSKDEFAKISLFGVGEPNTAFAKYFSGKSYLNPISTAQVKMFNVVFEPACRNNWHIHHAKKGGGQILIATAGRGYYQEWGKEAIEMKAGDVVNIPAGVKHWHGAAKDSWFAHIAVEVDGEETSNEWLEPVSNQDYGKLK